MMFKHNLKIAWRNLLKYKQQTLISILGLGVGLASFVVCNNNLRDELMRDRRLSDVDHIFVLATSNADYAVYPLVEASVAGMIRDEFPEIEKSTIFFDLGGYTDKTCVVEHDDGTKTWKKESFLYADSSFMDYFGFKLLQGNWETVKRQPDAVVLTPSAARRIFGTTDAIGRTFADIDDFDNTHRLYRVAAIMQEFPQQTRFDERAGLVLNPRDSKTISGNYTDAADVFVRLRPGVRYEVVNKKLAAWLERHPELKEKQNVPCQLCPYLQLREHWGPDKRWTFPLIFAGIGLLVLLTAIFNYVLFLSGRMLNRQKEYAIRQVSGASYKAIFRMFAMESCVMMVLVMLVSLILMEVFIHISPEDNSLNINGSGRWILAQGVYLLEYSLLVWGIILLVGWAILKRIQAITSLRNLQGGGVHHRSRVQNILLGIQLGICVLLGGGAYFLYAQQQYLQSRMMGKLSREECQRIYSFSLNGRKLRPIRLNFRNMVETNPYIELASRNNSSLLSPWTVGDDRWHLDGVKMGAGNKLHFMVTDINYPEFIHAGMEQGRYFRDNEQLCAVVNREFIRCYGINPLGKEISFKQRDGMKKYNIVGIIEDILTSEENPQVVPCIYLPYNDHDVNLNYYIKLRPGADPEVLEPLRAKMREQVNVFTPLWIETLEEEISWGTENLQEIGLMMGILSLVCIIISLLGIYSSMMLAVEKRSREMAIRKINGATISDIARIFIRHYLGLTSIAVLVAFPALFLGVYMWLENYSYHIRITPWPFILIFVVVFAVLLLTIGSQLLKIMRINPAERLKSE